MSEKPQKQGFAVQIIRVPLEDAHASMFQAPDGYEPYPYILQPVEVIEQVQLAVKLIKVPAVLVVWRRPLPDKGASGDKLVGDDGGPVRHDA